MQTNLSVWLLQKSRKARRVFFSRKRINIYFVGSREMQRLNTEYHGVVKPTNVLSFPYDKKNPLPPPHFDVGEVYLCIPYIRKQVRDKIYGNQSVKSLALWLLIHGMLHCEGYTHEQNRDKIRMEKKEKEILDHLL